jgi:hypothetical protein
MIGAVATTPSAAVHEDDCRQRPGRVARSVEIQQKRPAINVRELDRAPRLDRDQVAHPLAERPYRLEAVVIVGNRVPSELLRGIPPLLLARNLELVRC